MRRKDESAFMLDFMATCLSQEMMLNHCRRHMQGSLSKELSLDPIWHPDVAGAVWCHVHVWRIWGCLWFADVQRWGTAQLAFTVQ